MKIKPILRAWQAFTIVEVLISITIIGIISAGLIGCFHFSMFAIRMARENQRATQIILERAEAIRCYSWANLQYIPKTPVLDYYNSATHENPVYSVQTSLASFPYSTSYQNKMQQLTIVVRWTNWGVARSRTNITYIAFDGIQNYVF